ncbi:recombinase family protein [Streptomyces sp. NRRL B-1140]|uniref:recombinase family protein n=1 Tax=Streptomyces sp. NRRL B-1140 TaxID=1415549 RepID=UPI001F48DBFA|nr:recombinase family protein [Streptomyces sp. NRRL B-1140]
MFDRYLKGDGAAPLAKGLHSRGICTAGGKAWNSETLRALLDSRQVAGIRMHQGEEAGPGAWPAIIDAGVWAEARLGTSTGRRCTGRRSASRRSATTCCASW